jgi:large subunit ribosomal protein L7/L12
MEWLFLLAGILIGLVLGLVLSHLSKPVVARKSEPPPPKPIPEVGQALVLLKDSGPNKIMVIKVVREVTHLGLKEAKELVDRIPSVIIRGISRYQAEEIRSKLVDVGAKVEIG